MPESRDRLSRPVDIAQVFASRRSGALGVSADQQEMDTNLFGSPVHRAGTQTATGSMAAHRSMSQGGASGRAGGLRRASFGTPRARNRRGRNLRGTPAGRENTPAGGARRGRRHSVLPPWYPRNPLHDITAIVRAIERRRASLREVEGQPVETPVTHERRVLDSPVVPSSIQLEQRRSILSPNPTVAIGRCSPSVGKVSKILHDVTSQSAGESESLTPQKKLLNSIDTVEKLVTEELQKLKRTPTAKKAEREKKVRTLMSMR